MIISLTDEKSFNFFSSNLFVETFFVQLFQFFHLRSGGDKKLFRFFVRSDGWWSFSAFAWIMQKLGRGHEIMNFQHKIEKTGSKNAQQNEQHDTIGERGDDPSTC